MEQPLPFLIVSKMSFLADIKPVLGLCRLLLYYSNFVNKVLARLSPIGLAVVGTDRRA